MRNAFSPIFSVRIYVTIALINLLNPQWSFVRLLLLLSITGSLRLPSGIDQRYFVYCCSQPWVVSFRICLFQSVYTCFYAIQCGSWYFGYRWSSILPQSQVIFVSSGVFQALTGYTLSYGRLRILSTTYQIVRPPLVTQRLPTTLAASSSIVRAIGGTFTSFSKIRAFTARYAPVAFRRCQFQITLSLLSIALLTITVPYGLYYTPTPYRIVGFTIVQYSSLDFIRPAPYINDKIRPVTSSSDKAFSKTNLIYGPYFSFLSIQTPSNRIYIFVLIYIPL